MLKPLLLSPALLLWAFLPAASAQKPSKKAAAQPAAPATIEVQPPRAGTKQMYNFDCAICHGATGNGKTDLATSMKLNLADWTTPAALSGKTDQQLFSVIRKGNDKMPPEDSSRAKDDEINGLIKYIRGFATAAPATPAATPATTPAATAAPPNSPSTK